jgi:predicted ATPase/DNA-binding CsgD family transcriptional regulator
VGDFTGANRGGLLARAGDGWPRGLPVPLTPFVGREREGAEVARLVSANRLVTLVGAGGVGKTRLAVEVAAAVAADFGDGAGSTDLSAVTDPVSLAATLAADLGVEERAGADVREPLLRVLHGQHRLLVVDNCEHLRAAFAEFVVALLGSCPEVVVLATSREPLGVPGEVAWRVPSLAFPWPERMPAERDLESFEAAALFLARARAARPGLVIGPGDVAAVTSICFHLDGIPLALELAAARAGALSLQEIAARLTGCMELLARTGAGPARQQTLRASVEWSHRLLSEPERAVFRRLAVFAGGWPLEAAETVCSLPPAEQGEIAGLLAGLVDKSLVQADHTPAGSRYRLLEVIRAFASERLVEAGELEQVRERHAGYYTDLAERATAEVWGPGMTGWVPRMDQEADNLRAARRWCARDPARAGTGLRLAAGVWGYWFILGRVVECAAWLEEALARQGGPGHVRAVALNGLGLIACFRGEPERGRDLCSASIECFQGSPGGRDEGRVWANLCYARGLCGDAAGAAEAYDHALALARRDGDAWVEAAALWRMGFALALAGDVVRAQTLAAAGAALFSKTGDSRLRAYTLATVGECLTREGKPAEAIAQLREAVGVFEKLPERVGLLRTAIWLAKACAAAGDWPRAAMLLGVVDMLSERIGGQPYAFMQAGLDAVAARGPAELGPAWQPARQAGQVLGRGDQIAATLWPTENREAAPRANGGLPLTPRECEVAELIARGLTNRQIAARLFIAERTADTHVSNILAKLGCASRAQVAAIIAARSAAGAITRTKGAPGRRGGG